MENPSEYTNHCLYDHLSAGEDIDKKIEEFDADYGDYGVTRSRIVGVTLLGQDVVGGLWADDDGTMYAYVLEEHRRKGLFEKMLQVYLKMAEASENMLQRDFLTAGQSTPESAGLHRMFYRNGFVMRWNTPKSAFYQIVLPRLLVDLQAEVAEWADHTFPGQTTAAKIEHLRREVEELRDNPEDSGELADVQLLLCHIAHRAGVDLMRAAQAKLLVNRQRTWGEPDADGVVHHVEQVPSLKQAAGKVAIFLHLSDEVRDSMLESTEWLMLAAHFYEDVETFLREKGPLSTFTPAEAVIGFAQYKGLI